MNRKNNQIGITNPWKQIIKITYEYFLWVFDFFTKDFFTKHNIKIKIKKLYIIRFNNIHHHIRAS